MGEWEVWVCYDVKYGQHSCGGPAAGAAAGLDDAICFVYSEVHRVFLPWGYRSALNLF